MRKHGNKRARCRTLGWHGLQSFTEFYFQNACAPSSSVATVTFSLIEFSSFRLFDFSGVRVQIHHTLQTKCNLTDGSNFTTFRTMTAICFVCNLPILSHQVGLVWQGGNGWDDLVREQVEESTLKQRLGAYATFSFNFKGEFVAANIFKLVIIYVD